VIDQPDQLGPFLHDLGRDHRKFDVRPAYYDDLSAALIYSLKLHLRDRWTPETEQAWTDAFAIIKREMVRAAEEADTLGPPHYRGSVVDVDRPGPGLAIIRVRPDPPLAYLPGQYVSVETPHRPRMWRAMSMANPPTEGRELEFHVKTVPGGWVSGSIVNDTRAGDVWRIGPPIGLLGLVTRSERDLLMIGGGVGIAPLLSIVPELERRSSSLNVSLFHGVRHTDELYLNSALDKLCSRDPNLEVVKVVSREPTYDGLRGSLPEVVAKYRDWSAHDVVVSGSPTLIQATVRTLSSHGVPLSHIYYDSYSID
jgi:NAD(P)H-flavin reductase